MNDEALLKKLEDIKIPAHVGIIIDGNRRWAKKHGYLKYRGHTAGFKLLKKIIKFAFKTGIKHLSIYALSIENLKREERELKHLFSLLKKGLAEIRQDKDIMKESVKINILGRTYLLPKDLQEEIKKTHEFTRNNNKLTLNFCIAYNGQDEIVDAVKEIINKNMPSEEIDRNIIKSHLYTRNSPEADLIIRTGMEDGKRISGFLLWDASYAEFIFRDDYWPDYTKDMFVEDLIEYSRRNRRRGK